MLIEKEMAHAAAPCMCLVNSSLGGVTQALIISLLMIHLSLDFRVIFFIFI